MLRILISSTLLIAVVILPTATRLQADEQLSRKKRFLEMYNNELGKQRVAYINGRTVSILETRYNYDDDTILEERVHTIQTSDSCLLCESCGRITSKRDSEGKLYGSELKEKRSSWKLVRPDAYYSIARSYNSDEYLINQMVKEPDDSTAFQNQPLASFYSGVSVRDIVSNPKSRIHELEDRSWKGKPSRCLQVDDTFGENKPRTRKFYFDQASHWILMAIEYYVPERHVIDDYTYHEDNDGVKRLVKIEQTEKNLRTNKNRKSFTFDFSSDVKANHEPSVFSLEKFGLPDPVAELYTKKTSTAYIYLFGAACLSGIVSMYFYKAKHQPREASSMSLSGFQGK